MICPQCGHKITYQGLFAAECATDPACPNYKAGQTVGDGAWEEGDKDWAQELWAFGARGFEIYASDLGGWFPTTVEPRFFHPSTRFRVQLPKLSAA